jgi:hypothetical protein
MAGKRKCRIAPRDLAIACDGDTAAGTLRGLEFDFVEAVPDHQIGRAPA